MFFFFTLTSNALTSFSFSFRSKSFYHVFSVHRAGKWKILAAIFLNHFYLSFSFLPTFNQVTPNLELTALIFQTIVQAFIFRARFFFFWITYLLCENRFRIFFLIFSHFLTSLDRVSIAKQNFNISQNDCDCVHTMMIQHPNNPQNEGELKTSKSCPCYRNNVSTVVNSKLLQLPVIFSQAFFF